ncbi:aminotransferase class I/II-fold pyridoxal phosphate-dependent enzyme [Amphibacillus sediminis]|uniref:aminotransferase class I/II-fold pyridoxal phosphate-dependent enzyme n=1 Tax=Amphibacillus sediminis TaxID=360185 RepID=UPI000834C294|nr:aminotransferase class I/II-fold pyridoxal phosphate-dependent enzyme [Amphibacillus sediminis]
MNHARAPLWDQLKHFQYKDPISFHVPGHKNGFITPSNDWSDFKEILKYDLTELSGLDDLHNPTGVIKEAQALAANWFGAKYTHFLVGGSTVGNLAMILATCNPNDQVLVQRNCHKSILNGLELSGVTPIFLTPQYDVNSNRFTFPTIEQYKAAIDDYQDIKVVIVTYPDYFGDTFMLKSLIDYAHQHGIVVLVDEAHGVHFSLNHAFTPPSAVKLGADIVVQSAHKMAPAMTMTAYLHIGSTRVDRMKIESYLTMLQSSSPSYLMMASLDLARQFLARLTDHDIVSIEQSVMEVRDILAKSPYWDVLPINGSDPLKIVINIQNGYSVKLITELFEAEAIYPEFSTDQHIVWCHGLAPFQDNQRLREAVEKVTTQLNFSKKHVKIKRKPIYFGGERLELEYSFQQMSQLTYSFCEWEAAENKVAAEAVVPYPPGIPIIQKGERITKRHIELITYLNKQRTNFQQAYIDKGVLVFKGE